MSISSTRKVSSSSSTVSGIKRSASANNGQAQYVENIDTTNNVLVRDENNNEKQRQEKNFTQKEEATNYKTASPEILNSIEAIASTIPSDDSETQKSQINKVNIDTTNQSIVHDKDVEKTGHTYLKHFYEKNEHIIDVDELV